MDSNLTSAGNEESRTRKRRRVYVDAGVSFSLLLVLICVLIADLNMPIKIDLVFILDQRATMRELISGMKANCIEKAEALRATGADCRFAVIPFGKKRHRVPAVLFTNDVDVLKKHLLSSTISEPPETAASSVDAIKQAMLLDFREDAQALFFLISKQPSQVTGEFDKVASEMRERGITAIVQADAHEQARCQPLYQNGRFFSMEGDEVTASVGQNARTNSRAASLLAQVASRQRGSASQFANVKGIYGVRTSPNRQKMSAKLGATVESELAVQAGLEWLARHQGDDGHWSDESKCERERPCQSVRYGATHAETGLAILAFQAGGHYYFNDNEYSENVIRGLDWLVERQQENGCLFGPVQSWYEHGMAAFALAEACAVALANDRAPEERYLNAATRAVEFIEAHQYESGGWQYALDSQGVGDTSVSGWQVLALKSAMEAKIAVSPKTIDRVRKFYEDFGDPDTGQTGYQHRGGGSDLTTSVGLIVQEFILNQPKSPLATQAINLLRRRAAQNIGQTGDFYTLYNGTLAMFLSRGEAWNDWNRNVRDAVIKRQEKIGCARGSWNHSYNRTLDTAWAVLTLEVYYRYSLE